MLWKLVGVTEGFKVKTNVFLQCLCGVGQWAHICHKTSDSPGGKDWLAPGSCHESQPYFPSAFTPTLHPLRADWMPRRYFRASNGKRVHAKNLPHPMRYDISHHINSYLQSILTHTHTHTQTPMHAHESIQIPFTTLMRPPSCDINRYVNAPLMCWFVDAHIHPYTHTHTHIY